VRSLIELRRRHPVLRRRHFLKGGRGRTTREDIAWFKPDGAEMTDEEWNHEFVRSLGVYFAGDQLDEPDERGRPVIDDDFLVLFNAHDGPLSFTFPVVAGSGWRVVLDTARDQPFPSAPAVHENGPISLDGRSLVVALEGRDVVRRRTECRSVRSSETGTLFRLWAPGANEVDLLLDAVGIAVELAMSRAGSGWYQRAAPGIGTGARYALRIDHRLTVPDPASRANPGGVHAQSTVVDPGAYAWRDGAWLGRPWTEAVIYELHVGAFTPAGTFAGAIERLDDLVDLGVTALELMPVAAFQGERNWGYDGVLPFAPAASYGTPDDLKRLVDEAHARGLMVLLDVVYNHFGPEGNYLHSYAPQFFNPRYPTPWGAAINFDGEASATVRDFFVHNALYWLEEFHFDGLRLDAVHAIVDDSRPDFVTELATLCEVILRTRHVLVLENDRNQASYLARCAPPSDARNRAVER
jgi:pullulanase/glycogen debranching enzyme